MTAQERETIRQARNADVRRSVDEQRRRTAGARAWMTAAEKRAHNRQRLNHGTNGGYQQGCRCKGCTYAHTSDQRERRGAA